MEEYGGFHHIVGGETGFGEDGLYVGQRLCRPGFDAFGYEAGGGVDGNLSGSIDECARVDGLAVGADGSGSGGGAYCFFIGYIVG